MCLNRVSAVYYHRIVAALVEHTKVKTQNGGIIDAATHTALIGGYYHSVVAVKLNIGNGF